MLFLVSAVLFGIAGVQTGDWMVFSGGVVFGVACVVGLLADP